MMLETTVVHLPQLSDSQRNPNNHTGLQTVVEQSPACDRSPPLTCPSAPLMDQEVEDEGFNE